MPCIVQVRNNLILMNRKLIKYKALEYFSITFDRSTSEHNKEIQAGIMKEIINQPDNKVSEESVKGIIIIYTSLYEVTGS